jgi:phage terminase large subunit-like protein
MAKQPILSVQDGKQALAAKLKVDVLIYGGAAGCVDMDTEFLSQHGWKKISEYEEGDLVMQVDPNTSKAFFVSPEEYHKIPCDELTRFSGKSIDQCLSDEHKVLYYNDSDLNKPKVIPFSEMKRRHDKSKTKGFSGKFKTAYDYGGDGLDISEGELRLQVAVMADGRIVNGGKNNYTQMRFSKYRKYERLLNLLNEFGLEYKDNGCKHNGKYSNNKEYEVIVWPKFNDKIFDSKYLKCSKDQLRIIYDEVFHWDGTHVSTGTKRFFTKHKKSADYIQFVCNALGYNAGISTDHRYDNEQYTVNTYSTGNGFKGLANKDGKVPLESYKTLDGFKYCFTVETGFFLIRRNDKVVVTGNSGKSRLLLTKAGYYAYRDPNFSGVMFRRTSPPLRGAGGLFTEAAKLFSPFKPRVRNNAMEIIFEQTGGGTLKFTHLENEGDEERNHQGLQYSFVAFDELTHFTQDMMLYLIGRLRSESETPSFLMATTNPDPDSWVLDWVKYYLDEKGYPDEDLCGKIRYFVISDNKPHFADTEEELAEQFPDLCWVDNPLTGEKVYVRPMTFAFIGGTIFDNPALIRLNPSYLSSLKAQTAVNRARLLDGNWYARPEGSTHFSRAWLKQAAEVPQGSRGVRSWDIAHTKPSDKNRYPDYTASVKMYKDSNDEYYIVGDYNPDCCDSEEKFIGKFRRGFGERDEFMIMQAYYDQEACGDKWDFTVTVPQDGGAGKTQAESLIKQFTNEGFKIEVVTTTNAKGAKERRFSGFSSACQNGLVHVVKSSFDDETYEMFMNELEKFDGTASTGTKKDDIVDVCADAFNFLQKTKVHKAVSIGSISAPTKVSSMKKTMY